MCAWTAYDVGDLYVSVWPGAIAAWDACSAWSLSYQEAKNETHGR